jgi:hypothetical protein
MIDNLEQYIHPVKSAFRYSTHLKTTSTDTRPQQNDGHQYKRPKPYSYL